MKIIASMKPNTVCELSSIEITKRPAEFDLFFVDQDTKFVI